MKDVRLLKDGARWRANPSGEGKGRLTHPRVSERVLLLSLSLTCAAIGYARGCDKQSEKTSGSETVGAILSNYVG